MPILRPLAIALQGIGYGRHLTALQGLAAVDEAAAPTFRGVVITRAYLEQMRARRLALAPKQRAREKTRREADEDLEEFTRVQAAQAERAARLGAEAAATQARTELAAAEAAQAIARAAARARRRKQQQLVVLLA